MAKLCIETALDLRTTARGSGGLFRFIVLGLLRACGPQHGYGLMKAFERRSGLRVSSGNFYRELRRLAADGLVTSATRGDQKNARRLAYVISDIGLLMFDEWFLMAPMPTGRGPDDLTARTLFFGDTDAAAVVRLLEAWERDIWFQNKLLERGRAAAAAATSKGEFAVLPLLLSRQVRHLALDVEFVEQLRTAFHDWSAAHTPPVSTVAEPATAFVKRSRRSNRTVRAAAGRRN